MTKTYEIYMTKNYEKGGDFRHHFIAECDTKENAYQIAREEVHKRLCEITIYLVEHFKNGSERTMVDWRGVNL